MTRLRRWWFRRTHYFELTNLRTGEVTRKPIGGFVTPEEFFRSEP